MNIALHRVVASPSPRWQQKIIRLRSEFNLMGIRNAMCNPKEKQIAKWFYVFNFNILFYWERSARCMCSVYHTRFNWNKTHSIFLACKQRIDRSCIQYVEHTSISVWMGFTDNIRFDRKSILTINIFLLQKQH